MGIKKETAHIKLTAFPGGTSVRLEHNGLKGKQTLQREFVEGSDKTAIADAVNKVADYARSRLSFPEEVHA